MSNQALKSNIEKYETTAMYGQKQALLAYNVALSAYIETL